MDDSKPSWRIVRPGLNASGIAASSIGLVLNYSGREARLSIALGQPLNTKVPENELLIAELKILQNAIAIIAT